MSKLTRFENVEVSFSTMLNKLESKNFYGRMFTIKVPKDSPELASLQEQFKTLEKNAQTKFSEDLGKKVKPASRERGTGKDLFEESQWKEGFMELTFQVTNVREKEDKQEDGTVKKVRYEVLNKVYSSPDFCYKVNNNGEKEYKTEQGKNWYPLNTNIININVSLMASYIEKESRVKIQLKANDVEIIDSKVGSKTSGSKTKFLTLDEDEEVTQTVTQTSTPKITPKKIEGELLSANELASLDI
jgi:hypothetical protein